MVAFDARKIESFIRKKAAGSVNYARELANERGTSLRPGLCPIIESIKLRKLPGLVDTPATVRNCRGFD